VRQFLRSKAALWLSGSALLALGFAKLTNGLVAGNVPSFDEPILETLAAVRSPTLTTTALDVTALGSATLLVLFASVGAAAFLFRGDRLAALQIAIAAVCAPILSSSIKHYIERPRPTEVDRVVEVSGFSYPSGHSTAASMFWLTFAIVVWTRNSIHSVRVGALVLAVALIFSVALSRAYLGVHYPSDTLAGVTIGAGAALLLAGFFSVALARRRSVALG
jgi:undecaprenyl-diphosphatase